MGRKKMDRKISPKNIKYHHHIFKGHTEFLCILKWAKSSLVLNIAPLLDRLSQNDPLFAHKVQLYAHHYLQHLSKLRDCNKSKGWRNS